MTEQLIKTISKYINSIYKPVKIDFRESYNYENNNIKKEFIIEAIDTQKLDIKPMLTKFYNLLERNDEI